MLLIKCSEAGSDTGIRTRTDALGGGRGQVELVRFHGHSNRGQCSREDIHEEETLPSKREIIPISSESTPKLRATFTDEFKRDAVARLRAGNQSATYLAIELGLRRNQLYKWAKKLDEQSLEEALRWPGRPPTGNLSEIQQLRHDLASA